MDSIVPSIKKVIFNSSVKDLSAKVAEVGLDGIINNELLVQIPIVRAIVGIGKTAQNVRDRHFLKQTLQFTLSLNEGEISKEKLEKHKAKLDSDPEFAEEELGRVLVLLDSAIDSEKATIFAALYRSYVEEEINWDEFKEVSEITSRLFLSDLALLRDVRLGRVRDTTQCDAYRAERLNAVGLVHLTMKTVRVSSGPSSTDRFIRTTSLGEKYCDMVMSVI